LTFFPFSSPKGTLLSSGDHCWGLDFAIIKSTIKLVKLQKIKQLSNRNDCLRFTESC